MHKSNWYNLIVINKGERYSRLPRLLDTVTQIMGPKGTGDMQAEGEIVY